MPGNRIFAALVEVSALAVSAWILSSPDERKQVEAQAWKLLSRVSQRIAFHAGRIAIETEKIYFDKVQV